MVVNFKREYDSTSQRLPRERKKEQRNFNPRFLVILMIVALGGSILKMSTKDFIIYRDGKPELAPWRMEKLQKELEEMEDAEQYVLLAAVPGYYTCYNCLDKKNIFLNLNEVWRYGVTTKTEKGRYPNGLPHPNLAYVPQFLGSLQECLKEEKKKIYHYAVLPENLKRERPLIRPPGNKIDR